MVNISHANRYFPLRFLAWPIAFPLFLYRYWRTLRDAQKYILGQGGTILESRYEGLISLFERAIFLLNISFTFLYKKRIPKSQAVFVVNSSLNWKSIALLREIIRGDNALATLFLGKHVLLREYSFALDLIDVAYEDDELENLLINEKRSVIIGRDMLLVNPLRLELIRRQRLPIVPVFMFRSGARIFYNFGEHLRFRDQGTLSGDSLGANFQLLEGDFMDWYSGSLRNKGPNLKKQFTIN